MDSKIFDVINHHHQKYRNSCSPSLVEMLLKLENAVPGDYYDEQDRDKDQNVGLANIANKTIYGLTFRRFDAQVENKSLQQRIDEELAKGQFLGVYLPVGGGVHSFVIAGKVNQEYLLLSKYSELGNGEGSQTIEGYIPAHAIPQLERFDVIYYAK